MPSSSSLGSNLSLLETLDECSSLGGVAHVDTGRRYGTRLGRLNALALVATHKLLSQCLFATDRISHLEVAVCYLGNVPAPSGRACHGPLATQLPESLGGDMDFRVENVVELSVTVHNKAVHYDAALVLDLTSIVA